MQSFALDLSPFFPSFRSLIHGRFSRCLFFSLLFSEQVHLLNQEVHKNLRRNKTGIHVDRIDGLSPEYKRPPGFTLLPTLLNASLQNKTLDKHARRPSNFCVPAEQRQSSNKLASIVSKFGGKSLQADVPSQMIRHKPPSKNEMLRLEI